MCKLQHSDTSENWGFVLLGDGRVQCGRGGGYCVSVEFTALMKAVCLISEQHNALRPPAVCLAQIERMLFKIIEGSVSGSVCRDSSVGIATRYRPDGPRIESLRRRDSPHLSRPAVWPTQPAIHWVPGLSGG
jgi:hypothetical protein